MLLRLVHIFITGHFWTARIATVCPPDEGLCKWYSTYPMEQLSTKFELVTKHRFGYATALLTCTCGAVKVQGMIGRRYELKNVK